MNLHDYLKTTGRGALQRLSKDITAYGITAHAPDVSRWASGERPIPVHQAAAIERATGGFVTRQEMFPDDWARIWPELTEHKPDEQAVDPRTRSTNPTTSDPHAHTRRRGQGGAA